MANKIKCTCGHSWNKSDSSKKDMYICHVCGNSNVPKAQVGEEIPASKITPEMIKGWGEYRNYLGEQGLYGDPRLNTAFGKKTFIDWATKNPSYGVNWETLPIIGQELAAHKQKVKEAVGRGKVSLNTPVSEFNATDVTNAKSKNPWWPGTEFTAQEFAEYEEKVLDPKGKVIKEKNFGVLPSTETYDKDRINVDKKDIPVNIVKSIAKQKSGGWLSKYEKAENGIEGTMGGLTDKGFNYNGAWGGPSMAMGGNIPGTVGFTYARTGGIPSNGPYAKKTKASAQNGMEMKFYQEGLDWKPRNISRDGSEIPKAQVGLSTGDIASLPGVRKDIPLSKEQLAKNKKAVEERTKAENAKILKDRQARIKASEEAKKKPFSAQRLAEETQATGDKFRLFPNDPNSFIDEYLNPGVIIGNMASGLGRVPLNIQQGNYGQAALDVASPLTTGALASIGAKGTSQFINNIVNPLAGISLKPLSKLSKVEPKFIGSSLENVVNKTKNLEDLQAAQKFAEQYGYELPTNLERIAQSDELTNRTIRGMMDRHNTFVRGVSTNWDEIEKRNPEILRHLEGKGIDWKNNPKAAAEYMSTHVPIKTGYGRASLNKDVFKKELDAIYTSNSIPTAEGYTYGQGYITKVKRPTDFSSVNRQDWITRNNPQYYEHNLPRTYSRDELDQIKGWRGSDPYSMFDTNALGSEENVKKVHAWLDDFYNKELELRKSYGINTKGKGDYHLGVDESGKEITFNHPNFQKLRPKKIEDVNNFRKKRDDLYDETMENTWKTLVPVDEVNFTKKLLKTEHFGKSDLNIDKYAHYLHLGTPGEKMLEPIKSWEITPEIWKNKSRAHTNVYSKKLSALEEGGVIKDDMGQWAHPGEITEIGSPYITMEGVPYPVLGVSDTGDTKMMEPGKDYKFKGKKVTEYPVGKKWLEKYK